jgi:hypothetical protein
MKKFMVITLINDNQSAHFFEQYSDARKYAIAIRTVIGGYCEIYKYHLDLNMYLQFVE